MTVPLLPNEASALPSAFSRLTTYWLVPSDASWWPTRTILPSDWVTSASPTKSPVVTMSGVPPPLKPVSIGGGGVGTATLNTRDVVAMPAPVASVTASAETTTLYGPLSAASHDPPGTATVYVAVTLS